MFKVRIALLTFFCLSICMLSSAIAKDVGKHETVVRSKKYANAPTTVVACVNAVLAQVETYVITKEAAATHDVASLTKTPTVEVKAKAAVAGNNYQRLCGNASSFYKINSIRKVSQYRYLHIDPGLRGC